MSELERWEARFAAPGYHFGTEPNAFLKSKAHLLKRGQKALSIADGEGRNGVFLAEQGLDVMAFDFSPNALAKSRALAKERGVAVRFEQADLDTCPWPIAAFDVVVGDLLPVLRAAGPGQGVRGHQARAEARRAAADGGLHGRSNSTTSPAAPPRSRTFTRGRCWRNLSPDFSSLAIEEYDNDIRRAGAWRHGRADRPRGTQIRIRGAMIKARDRPRHLRHARPRQGDRATTRRCRAFARRPRRQAGLFRHPDRPARDRVAAGRRSARCSKLQLRGRAGRRFRRHEATAAEARRQRRGAERPAPARPRCCRFRTPRAPPSSCSTSGAMIGNHERSSASGRSSSAMSPSSCMTRRRMAEFYMQGARLPRLRLDRRLLRVPALQRRPPCR